jgi:hypothetical protein
MNEISQKLIHDYPIADRFVSFRSELAPEIENLVLARKHDGDQSWIDAPIVHNLTILVVGNAERHTDPDFAWTLLWVLHSEDHNLHVRRSRKSGTEIMPLGAGALVAFDSRLPHWTTSKPGGVLVCAGFEFCQKPSIDDVEKVMAGAIEKVRNARYEIEQQFTDLSP